MSIHGIIMKGIGGFYYVDAGETVFECKARGVFRKRGQTPLVGDRVVISVPETGYALIDEIEERKNSLVRPPLANLDKLFIVVSSCSPSPNTLVIDRLISHAEKKQIEPILIFTKNDIGDCSTLGKIYEQAGFTTVFTDYSNPSFSEKLKCLMKDSISAFAGNSGVGKSTLLNAIMPQLQLKTGEISEKLGRGKHTTRQAELFKLPFGGMIADTPGFSSLDIENGEVIHKEELADCFREFADYMYDCRFTSCSHTVEKGCAVLKAIEDGKIAKSRHDSYVALYNEVKDLPPWEY